MNLPELLSAKVPAGTLAAVARACDRYGVTASEYARAALHRQLTADALCPAALDVIAPRLQADKQQKSVAA